MPVSRRAIGLALAALGLAPRAFAQEDDPRPHSYALLGAPAPDFTLPRLGGGEAGRVAPGAVQVIAFGGLWCPDCLRDSPHVSALAQRIAAIDGASFLYVHSGPRFGRWGGGVAREDVTIPVAEAALNAYFAETGHAYPVAFDISITRDVAKSYAVEWYPTYVVVDRAGVIRAWRTDIGETGGAELIAAAQRLAA